jgi:hypothetical protein
LRSVTAIGTHGPPRTLTQSASVVQVAVVPSSAVYRQTPGAPEHVRSFCTTPMVPLTMAPHPVTSTAADELVRRQSTDVASPQTVRLPRGGTVRP